MERFYGRSSAVEEPPASDEEAKRVAKRAALPEKDSDATSIVAPEKSAAELKSKRERPQLGLILQKPNPKDQHVEGQEVRISLGMYRVVKPSPLHSKPRPDSDIIASLEPPVRVRVVRVVGNYLEVRSMQDRTIRGYIHREDAFFVPITR